MKPENNNRTVCPDAEAIRRLRLEKGWRTEDMARKAQCSVKTVDNVERGAKVYPFTLAKFAKAFGVEYKTLLPGSEPPVDPPRLERCVRVELKCSIPFDQFDESDQLLAFIAFLKGLLGGGDFNVIGVTPGSTVITLEMSVQNMVDLHTAYSQGKMKEILCEDFRLVYDTYLLDLDPSSKKLLGDSLSIVIEGTDLSKGADSKGSVITKEGVVISKDTTTSDSYKKPFPGSPSKGFGMDVTPDEQSRKIENPEQKPEQ